MPASQSTCPSANLGRNSHNDLHVRFSQPLVDGIVAPADPCYRLTRTNAVVHRGESRPHPYPRANDEIQHVVDPVAIPRRSNAVHCPSRRSEQGHTSGQTGVKQGPPSDAKRIQTLQVPQSAKGKPERVNRRDSATLAALEGRAPANRRSSSPLPAYLLKFQEKRLKQGQIKNGIFPILDRTFKSRK